MHDVNVARALMGDSLAFHIIFAMLGVGLPLIILLVEQLGLRRKDPLILEHARRLSHASILLVVVGVASGTIISIQMSLVWGHLIKFGGPVLGLAFGWEGYAFMLESVFLAFYVTSWGKIKGWKHWLIGVPVALGSLGSAFSITLGNAWMQNPGVLKIVDGSVVTQNPLSLLLTKTALFMTTHSIIGYYLATALCVLGIYAYYSLRYSPVGKERDAVRQIMFRLAATSVFFVVVTGLIGHLQTQFLAKSQPRKFAALEMVEQSGSHQPYILFGEWKANGTVDGGLRIPSGLSLLTGNSPNTRLQGLSDFPKQDWPMLFINKLFEVKLLLVAVIAVIPLAYVVLDFGRLRKLWGELRFSRVYLWAMILVGPIAIAVVELGWLVAEFGRQPFAVNGYLRTSEAFSATSTVASWGYIFPALFLVLFAVSG
ncbi:MAG: cytochrome ubiquinol oxidase subunit I, partial [Candidatus Saccharimonadales bacterium]